MTKSHQGSDSRDYERQFYTVLSGACGDWVIPGFAEVRQDIVDVLGPPKAVMCSEGYPVLILPFTNEGAKMVMDGAKHWQDHNCKQSIELGLFLLHAAAQIMEEVKDSLPPETQTSEPFKHDD